jgi:transposase
MIPLVAEAGGPMARRTFDVIDICEIFTHWHAGRSKNEIAGSLGLSRNTVRKYLAAAEAAGMSPGGPPVSQQEWAELARAWFPELADTRLRQVTWPAIAVHRDYIVEQLAAGVTMATIHQRLRDERGLAVSVASLRRYVAANLPEEARRSQVTVLRLVPAEPGAEAQTSGQSAGQALLDDGVEVASCVLHDAGGRGGRALIRTWIHRSAGTEAVLRWRAHCIAVVPL